MTNQQTGLSFKVAFLLSLFSFVVLLFSLIVQYIYDENRAIEAQYHSVQKALNRSVKILATLNYTLSKNVTAGEADAHFDHQRKLDNDLCYISPKYIHTNSNDNDNSQMEETREHLYRLETNYEIVGPESLCDEDDKVYQQLQPKLQLAPAFSLLSGIDPITNGLYFISVDDYFLVSPAKLTKNVDLDSIAKMQQSDYWQSAQADDSEVSIFGPYSDVVTGSQILTIVSGISDHNQFYGVIVIDIKLLDLMSEESSVTNQIHLIDLNKVEVPENAHLVYPLTLSGVKSSIVFYAEQTFSKHVSSFIKARGNVLFVLIMLFIFSVIVNVVVKFRNDKLHLLELSQQDSLTSLLNRRGFEMAYKSNVKGRYEALAMFDIDKFKRINDTYGHDVGDDVICYVASKLKCNTRNGDIISRFGGEEFALYLNGENAEEIIETVKRIQQNIGEKSSQVLSDGFTISAGLTIKLSSEKIELEALIKQADDKLYEAKNGGRNQVCY